MIKKLKQILSKSEKNKEWTRKSHTNDEIVKIDGREVSVGKYTYGVGNITLAHHKDSPILKIGRFCSIAGNVKIFTGANHRSDWCTTYPFGHIHEEKFGKFEIEGYPHSNGPVIIGNDVWVGNSVTIMSGVTIHDGAIIAANSHVIKDVQSYEIVGGNPAKHIKFRFDKEIIDLLLELRWWDLNESKIQEICVELMSRPDAQIIKELIKNRN